MDTEYHWQSSGESKKPRSMHVLATVQHSFYDKKFNLEPVTQVLEAAIGQRKQGPVIYALPAQPLLLDVRKALNPVDWKAILEAFRRYKILPYL